MSILYLDRETFGELKLPDVGAYQYAQSAHDLLISYAIDEAEPRVWDCTAEEMHDELYYAMEEAEEVWAHNAAFDRTIHNSPKQLRLPRIDLERWRCSMALALSHALPGKLDSLCDVLGVPTELAKLKDGKKLLNLFTKPQPTGRKILIATRETHPAEWERFKLYAANDITAMRECMRRMPRWNWDASAVAEWHLDQRINDRGFATDRELCVAGANAAVVEKERIGVRFRELTRGVVDRPSQRDQFKAYLNDQFGLDLDNTRGETFQQMMRDPFMDERARELMELSIASNKTSTAKYAALLPAIGADGRFRGGLQFAGASRTRRWAGRLFQPQNLPSRGLPSAEVVEDYIGHLKAGVHDLFHSDLMLLGAASLRGLVVPEKGNKLAVADLANIEGRVLAWLAGEKWKLDAFRAYDAGTGPDLYNITAVSIIGGDPWNVSKKDRNVFGKVPDLACLGADTQVLTSRGLVGIMEVLLTDLLWDGTAWVKHDGLKDNGVRPTVRVDGIAATPDHLINTAGTWRQAQELVSSGSMLSQALETGSANLPSSASSTDPQAGCVASWSGATVAPIPTAPCSATWSKGGPLDATCVRSAPLPPHEKSIGVTHTSARMTHTAAGCSAASVPVSTGALTPTTPHTKTMVGGVSLCTQCGRLTEQSSCGIYSLYPDGTTPFSNSTASESTRGTSPATCGSSRAAPTEKTNAACKTSNEQSPTSQRVYDLLNAGPRHRFVVKSASGWLLVHNSGYQGGVAGYQTFAKAYGVRMADHWGAIQKMINPMHVAKARENLDNWGYPQLESLEVSETEWLASETCKLAWRDRHPATVKLWYAIQDAAINAINEWGKVFAVGPFLKLRCVTHKDKRWLVVRLPSGRMLTYFEPHLMPGNKGRPSITYWGEASEEGKTTRQWIRVFTHGGKIVANSCQTVARDILVPSLAEAERRGYMPVLSVHDEALTEVPDNDDFSADELVQILATNPEWTPGLPLAAAGFECHRYKKE